MTDSQLATLARDAVRFTRQKNKEELDVCLKEFLPLVAGRIETLSETLLEHPESIGEREHSDFANIWKALCLGMQRSLCDAASADAVMRIIEQLVKGDSSKLTHVFAGLVLAQCLGRKAEPLLPHLEELSEHSIKDICLLARKILRSLKRKLRAPEETTPAGEVTGTLTEGVIWQGKIGYPQNDLRKQPEQQRQEDSLESLRERVNELEARNTVLQRENEILTRRCMGEQRRSVQPEIATLLAERVPAVSKAGDFDAWLGKFADVKVLDETLATEVTSVFRALGEQTKSQNQSLVDAANDVLAVLHRKYVALGQGKPFLSGIAEFEAATGCSLTHEKHGAIGLSPKQQEDFQYTNFKVRQRNVRASDRFDGGSTTFVKCFFEWHAVAEESSARSENPIKPG